MELESYDHSLTRSDGFESVSVSPCTFITIKGYFSAYLCYSKPEENDGFMTPLFMSIFCVKYFRRSIDRVQNLKVFVLVISIVLITHMCTRIDTHNLLKMWMISLWCIMWIVIWNTYCKKNSAIFQRISRNFASRH